MKRKILIFSAIFGFFTAHVHASDTDDTKKTTQVVTSVSVKATVDPNGKQRVRKLFDSRGYTELENSMDISSCEALYGLRETEYNGFYSKGHEVWRISDPKVEGENETFTSLIAHSCHINDGVLVTHLEFSPTNNKGLRALNSLLMHLTGISQSIRGVRCNNIACWVPKFENEKNQELTAIYLWLTENFKFVERSEPFGDLVSCQPLIPSQGKVQLLAKSEELRKHIVVSQRFDHWK